MGDDDAARRGIFSEAAELCEITRLKSDDTFDSA